MSEEKQEPKEPVKKYLPDDSTDEWEVPPANESNDPPGERTEEIYIPPSEQVGMHAEAPQPGVEGPSLPSDEEFERRQEHWLKNIYQGDNVPQLTLRAVIMGGILGSLMSISNLYTTLKVGWSFGVAITACVLSFVIWRTIRLVLPMLSPMSILENNCMQSTASAAGYSTGATIGAAFGALLLITGVHIDWKYIL